MAWGYVIYDRQLTCAEVAEHELTASPLICVYADDQTEEWARNERWKGGLK